ncbi:(2Fe-2S)-binding protein [Candidatus Micrarchaeota archaeon]|nr:(2Fe-2S)-binding protein [Candidatus Micrarchaeota archaeon]
MQNACPKFKINLGKLNQELHSRYFRFINTNRTFVNALKETEQVQGILAYPNRGMLDSKYIGAISEHLPIATGKMAAYAKKGHELGNRVEWYDDETGQRWVFVVPDQYKNEKGVLFVDHPFWVLEEDGNNFVVHSEPEKVELQEKFPRLSGAYGADRCVFPYIKKRMSEAEVAEFPENKGRRFGKGDIWLDVPSSAVNLLIEDSRVGPVLLSGKNYLFCTLWLNWKPGIECLLPLYANTVIQNILALHRISLESPCRKYRNLPEVKMAKVRVLRTGKSFELPEGSSLSNLPELPNGAYFSCMHGSCLRCGIRVTTGMENLEPPDEREVEIGRAYHGYRLACLARIREGEVEID